MVRDVLRGINIDMIEKFYKDFRKPDIIFYCSAPVEVAFERLMGDKNLSYYSSGMDLNLSDNKEKSCFKYEELMNKQYNKILSSKTNCVKLDMDKSIKKIFNDVKENIKKLLKKKNHKEALSNEFIKYSFENYFDLEDFKN